jgi:hypothetical protein
MTLSREKGGQIGGQPDHLGQETRRSQIMLTNAFISLEAQYKKWHIFFCILVASLVMVGDYITGRHIQFLIFYVLPVGMSALNGRDIMAYLMAIILPLIRIAFYFLWPGTISLSTTITDTLIAICALVIYSYLLNHILRQSKKIKILEGVLPICASCKRIRNENGQYEQIEKYITHHSAASFSHGICPECLKKLYPDFADKIAH